MAVEMEKQQRFQRTVMREQDPVERGRNV